MTHSIALRLSAAAMLAGLAFAASGTAEASMTSRLQKCQFASKQKVIDCCQHIVKTKKPAWMIENQSSCQTAAVCTIKVVPVSTNDTSMPNQTKTIKVCGIEMIPGGGGGGGGGGDTPPGDDIPDRPRTPLRG